jgi:hypothetical protein
MKRFRVSGPDSCLLRCGCCCCTTAATRHCREETGGFDTRPPHPEVRQRVDRWRDRQIRLESGKPDSGSDRCAGVEHEEGKLPLDA